jgi:hypothetical protein
LPGACHWFDFVLEFAEKVDENFTRLIGCRADDVSLAAPQ